MELTPVQKAFSLPELVSLILEYSASGQQRNDILQLRTVCRLWRRMAFRTLLSNSIVAEILTRHLGLYYVRETFPPDCHIPMQLSATNLDLEDNDIQFIQRSAHNVVSVKLQDVDVVSEFLHPVEKLPVELPHLKLIEFRIPNYVQFSDANPLHQLIGNLAENATRLKTYDLGVTVWHGDTLPRKLLRKITRLSVIFSSYSSLEQLLLENSLPKLTSLDLSTILEADSEVFTRIAVKLSGQLKSFSFPTSITSCFCDLLEKQKFGVMQKLDFIGRLEDAPNNIVQQISRIDAKIPTLTQLGLPILSAPASEKVLPLIFSRMTRLTTLSVSISHDFWRSRDYEIGKILTGLDAVDGFEPEDIDKESPLWPSFLEGNQNSITNLKNLKEFKLEVELSNNRHVVCRIPRFLFRAGFFQMPNLAKITLVNCVMNPGLIENYREETGRELILQNTRTQSPPVYELYYDTDSDSDSDSDG